MRLIATCVYKSCVMRKIGEERIKRSLRKKLEQFLVCVGLLGDILTEWQIESNKAVLNTCQDQMNVL